MEVSELEIKDKKLKKRGRKPKNEKRVIEINREQTKFYIDLSRDKKIREKLFNILEKTNDKDYGEIVTFKEVMLLGFNKLTEKDIDKLKESSLSEMEKVQRTVDEYNKKNATNLNLGEYLVKKLNIN